MLYSDLVLKLQATIATDGGSVLIEDVTGTYDPDNPTLNPGGYAPAGQGTLDRPSEDEVAKFLMYQSFPVDILNQEIPSEAVAPTHTFGLLDNLGNPVPDTVYQFVFMITSIDGDTWDALIVLANNSGDPWQYLVDYFSDNESGNPVQIGQLPVPVTVTATNCTNDARRRLNNAWSGGRCDCSEYALKKALLQGVYSCADIAGGFAITSASALPYWNGAQNVLDRLNLICADPNCQTC
jgi:hypothetical protein